jgi:hypothetical protein
LAGRKSETGWSTVPDRGSVRQIERRDESVSLRLVDLAQAIEGVKQMEIIKHRREQISISR